jgi:hypothetical protein
MARTLPEIVEAFSALTAEDFDLDRKEASGVDQLHALAEELLSTARPDQAAEIILSFIERVTAEDLRPPRYDFGTPGPLVHSLEKLPGYEDHLLSSLKRRPAPLTVWMLNRLINGSTKDRREQLLDCLRQVCAHPDASAYTRQLAEELLRFQTV